MPHAEYVRWMKYVERFGPLNPMLRMERAVANLAALWSKDAKPGDFMPWPAEQDTEATPEGALALLTSVSTPKPK